MITAEVLLGEFDCPVRPQGDRPTCLAFALCDLNRRFSPAELSPEYFYRAAARLIPNWRPGDGLQFAEAQQASYLGQPEEDRFPYCEADPDIPIPDLPTDLPMYGNALTFEPRDVATLAASIRAGRAIGLGLRTTQEFFHPIEGIVKPSATSN